MDVKLERVDMLLTQKGPEDRRMEERCTQLELEIRRVNSNCEAIEERNRALEVEKHEIESELLDLRRRNAELMGGSGKNNNSDAPNFVDLTEVQDEEEDAVFQLMMENKALECEKKKAERDAEYWKGKFEELVSWVSQKDDNALQELFRSLDRPGLSAKKEIMDLKKKYCGGFESNLCRKVRKQLVFEAEDGPTRKMDPATPGVAKSVPTSTININDSDEDDVEIDPPHLPPDTRFQNQESSNTSGLAKGASSVPTPKRKRASRVVASDTDSDDDDDDLPISRVKKVHVVESRDNGVISSGREHSRVISTAVDADEDDESESKDVLSDSEGPSLNGFIVSDGDDTTNELEDGDDATNESEDGDDATNESEDASDSETDFDKVISTIRRKRDCKPSDWKFEGDMLAAFGKDPELCMKAVCALYRQQTADERVSKGTFYSNQRGFSKFHASRGSKLGDFLTEGDPEGDLKKSVEELQEHDPKAVELCRTLATHYSKQLFEIYQKKEDPFFLPL